MVGGLYEHRPYCPGYRSARSGPVPCQTEGTKADWDIIAEASIAEAVGLPDRVLDHLRLLEGDAGGFAVTRLEHCLQTATGAYRGDRDDEYVFCALLHDIGDTLGSFNHADIAAAVVKPFVSEANLWMVEKHAISRATTSSTSSASIATCVSSSAMRRGST